jgi:hypothetical protein
MSWEQMHVREDMVPPSFVRELYIPSIGGRCGDILSKSLAAATVPV